MCKEMWGARCGGKTVNGSREEGMGKKATRKGRDKRGEKGDVKGDVG